MYAIAPLQGREPPVAVGIGGAFSQDDFRSMAACDGLKFEAHFILATSEHGLNMQT